MKKKTFFQTIYKYDEASKTYLIEVSLDDYDDVYDDWDASAFKKRDIEVEFNDFIVNSSEDIPLNYDISIVLYLPTAKKNHNKEIVLVLAYRNFYNYALERLHKAKIGLQKSSLSYFLLSFLMLSVGYFFTESEHTILVDVLKEGIFIGGWVFLWEFFTNVFIKTTEINNEYKLYKRLYESQIKFVYVD